MIAETKIERIEFFHVEVPLPTPLYPAWIPGVPLSNHAFTLVQITTRGGWVGRATAAAIGRERAGVGEYLSPFLLGLDGADVALAAERLRQSSVLGWNNAWVELAFWDIKAQARGVPLAQAFAEAAGATGAWPARARAIAALSEHRRPDIRAESLERARRSGFGGAEIPLAGPDEATDQETIARAREAVGPDFRLMFEARQSGRVSLADRAPAWDPGRAERILAAAAGASAEWVGDPLADRPLDRVARLRAAGGAPVGGGGAAQDLEALERRVALYDVLTPDPALVGIGDVLSLLPRLAREGRGFHPRSAPEGWSILANLHLVLAWAAVSGREASLPLPHEPPALVPELRDAVLSCPLSVGADGAIAAPEGPGLGARIEPRALARYAERFYTLTPVRFVASSARRVGLRQAAEMAKGGLGAESELPRAAGAGE